MRNDFTSFKEQNAIDLDKLRMELQAYTDKEIGDFKLSLIHISEPTRPY